VAGREWEAVRGRRHRRFGGGFALLVLLAVLGSGATTAGAVAPSLGGVWASAVFSSSARLHAEINPNGRSSSYHFDYITKAAYDANVAASRDPFTGTLRSPSITDANIGAGGGFVSALQLLSTLQADTVYRYRLVTRNVDGTTTSPTLTFTTFPQTSLATDACSNRDIRAQQGVSILLPDCRGWEMVSPIDKNGGQVDPPGALADGGVLQAAAQGGTVTYSSAASFAGGAGAPPASQYIATRTGSGWGTQNITVPIFSGSYDTVDGGAPYRLFSGDLARGLLLNGKRCRSEASAGCPVANPQLSGTDAPAGFQNYYLRTTAGGGFESLLGPTDVTGLVSSDFELTLAGASADLLHVILSTCARLTAGATDGCGANEENLYRWSGGSIALINTTPDAQLAAQSGAVSTNGSRVYWRDLASGNLFQGLGAGARQADLGAGGGGRFETASADGSIAYYTKDDDIWRYNATGDTSVRLTSTFDVDGVLGASSSGSHLYFLTTTGLFLCSNAATATADQCDAATRVANAADASNYPAASGTARVSVDGTKLLFMSTTPLRTYDGNTFDNTDLNTRAPDSQVYLYDTSGARLTCVSCNPSFGRPIGASSIPGATENGSDSDATVSYKPRALSADGQRVYFDSDDALVLSDTNADTDAYQWESQGSGSCTRPAGCIALISSGRATDGSIFVDASADGSDAFFVTGDSLVNGDPGSEDLYIARIGGGFPVPSPPIPCNGDACQVLPPEPVDPTLTTLLPGPGNPTRARVRVYGAQSRKTCPPGKRVKTIRKKNGRTIKKCVKRAAKKRSKREARR
jgi:hypothetical protein